jgi:protein O-mannosyl-transferase
MLAVCGLLLLLVWLVFGQTLDCGFVNFDDDVYVTENPELSQGLSLKGIGFALTTTRGCQWAPATWFSYLLDYQVYGLKPWGYHLTNVLLHAATVVLLFLVLRRMTGGLWPSAFVAALFAIHPLRVESVAWVAERKDVLSGLFFVLTLGAYLGYVRHRFSIGRYAIVAVLMTLGLMAKPMLVTLPLLLLLLDYWPLGRLMPQPASVDPSGGTAGSSSSVKNTVGRANRATRLGTAYNQAVAHGMGPLLLEKLPLLVIAAVFCAIAPWAQGKALIAVEKLPMDERISNAMVSTVAYLGMWIWPAKLAVFYPYPLDGWPVWKTAAALLVLVSVTAAVLVRRRRNPCLLVGWFWYLLMLVPVIGLVQVGRQAMADRYTYLPQIGLCIALAWGATGAAVAWPHRRWACGAASLLVVVGLAACASQQTTYWRDTEALWNRALACTTNNNRAHCNLAAELLRKRQFPEAIAQYDAALKIEPEDAVSYCGLGHALMGLGKRDKAIERFREAAVKYEKALEIRPKYVEAHSNLGNALARLGRYDDAIRHYEAALEIEPNRADTRFNLDFVRSVREKERR